MKALCFRCGDTAQKRRALQEEFVILEGRVRQSVRRQSVSNDNNAVAGSGLEGKLVG